MLYAADMVVVADSEADLQDRLIERKGIVGKPRLRVSLDKTEVLWVEQQKKIYICIRLERKKLSRRDGFVYLDGAV